MINIKITFNYIYNYNFIPFIILCLIYTTPTIANGQGILSDPLPIPKSIIWGDSGPLNIDIDKISLLMNCSDSENEDIIRKAFDRIIKTIGDEKWIPQTGPVYNHNDRYEFNQHQQGDQKLLYDLYNEYGNENDNELEFIKINISNDDVELQHGINESYTIKIEYNNPYIEISANTIWGILNSFSTFEQLIIYNEITTNFYIEQPVEIIDEPDFSYRGIMIDTARNFYSIDSLKRTINIMNLCKLNVLHLHLTDTQSWPIFINNYPAMINDAYSSDEIYSNDDIKNLVLYAKERGIRLIPELDTPGHSSSGWKQIDPDLITCSEAWWNDVAVEPGPGQLEILNPNLYKILKIIYDELSSLFIDDFFHVGFDELNINCYKIYSNLTIDWFNENSSRTFNDLAQYWIDNSLPIFNNTKNRRLIMWEDSITNKDFSAINIPKDIILQSWSFSSLNNVKKLTSMGYDVIISSADFLYLDCGFSSFLTNDPRIDVISDGSDEFNYGKGAGGSWCGPYKSWQRLYDFEFLSNLTDDEKDHVIGGSVALWSEQSDGNTIDTKLWPRVAAWAENIWSGNKDVNGKNRVTTMTQRILNFRERLIGKGIAAEALVPKYCMKNPHACDFTRNQSAVYPKYIYSSSSISYTVSTTGYIWLYLFIWLILYIVM